MKRVVSHKKRPVARIFSDTENQCVWMKAGVVNFKLCENAYDCLSCSFDKAMSRSMGKKPEAVTSWREAMKAREYNQRECRHMLTGRVQYHFCSNAYRCNICEYDQMLDEADLAKAVAGVHSRKVAGFAMADGYYYHRGHGWARLEHGGFVRIGLDDFALRLLGRPDEIRLPKLGSHVEQTEPAWSIRRDDHVADVLAPMNGVVLATNHKVLKEPAAAKTDPYGNGWLVVVEPQHLKENLRNLLFDGEAAAWLSAEAQRLEEMVMSAYGMPLAATGGEMVDDIFGHVSHLKWDDLVHEFLLT